MRKKQIKEEDRAELRGSRREEEVERRGLVCSTERLRAGAEDKRESELSEGKNTTGCCSATHCHQKHSESERERESK